MKASLYQYLLMLGDNSMILGHRLSELCGHGPNLETDIALTNISLDLFGQVRSYFQYAAKIIGEDATEDSIAFLRRENEYRNVLLVEQQNKDFAFVIVRQFLFDCYHLSLMESLIDSKDDQIKAIASKSIKESRYHYRFSSEWVRRLALGTSESREKCIDAFNYLFPYTNELFQFSDTETKMAEAGIGPTRDVIKAGFDQKLLPVIEEISLELPSMLRNYDKGKQGIHSEYLGFILADLQYMQRAYPNMEW
jgi:ring-1,2-phenylacetyl-CoA epoxidase subunit PaaC